MEKIKGMLDTEYNEAEVREAFMEDGRKEGLEEGRIEREELQKEINRLREENEELKKRLL